MNEPTHDRAEAVVEALEKAGITNDAPESNPNPYEAAQEAYLLWFQHLTVRDWRDMRKDVIEMTIPPIVRYRKLAVACREALKNCDVRPEKIEPITYAWGYFNALVEKAQAQSS